MTRAWEGAVADPRSATGRAGAGTRGFTVLEVLVFLVFGGLVVSTIHFLMVSHQREFGEQSEEIRGQGLLRNALVHVVGELREISPPGGDLVQIDSSSVRYRSFRGGGVVCGQAVVGLVPTYTVALEHGAFDFQRADSALALAIFGAGQKDDVWRALKVATVVDGVGGLPCQWTGAALGGLALGVQGDTSGVRVGSPVRAYRQVELGLFPWNGQWWMGRREQGSAWQPLVGPLLAPADSGLVLTYRDGDGNPVTTPSQVRLIEILLRAPRDRHYTTIDSLRTKVALRG